MDIIIIGRIAEDGILELIRERLENTDVLRGSIPGNDAQADPGPEEKSGTTVFSRYSKRYFSEGVAGLSAEFADEKCMKILDSHGADVFVVGRQGIFSALYKLGNTCGWGLRVELREIPVRQFCIEIADLLDVNPYTLSSLGCILACAHDGAALAAELENAGYPAKIIGYTTDDKACCAVNGEVTTYLEP